jgi:signal transduction histidine kinase
MLPLEELLDLTLALFAGLGPLHGPSVWVAGEPDTPRLLRWHGEVPAMVVPGLVSEVLDGSRPVHEGTWTALPVTSFQQPCAVLVFACDVRDRGPASAIATSLGRLLSRAFERASLFNSAAEHAAVLVRSSERRMTRIGFDLHDGALQDVALMVGELKAVTDELARAGGSARFGSELIGRVEDLAGLAEYLNENLREVANSLDASSEMRRPFGSALNSILRAFTVRTGVEPDLEITGDIDGLSESQRIALLRVAQECLTNVREHSGADRVRLTINAGPTKVEATIEDNGRGFEVDAALRDSARRGRMGLIGIMERIRLLGGFCDIQSSPGAGSRISLSVQRWTPEMAAEATAARTAAAS